MTGPLHRSLRDLGDRQVLLIAVVAGELRGTPAFAHPITHPWTPWSLLPPAHQASYRTPGQPIGAQTPSVVDSPPAILQTFNFGLADVVATRVLPLYAEAVPAFPATQRDEAIAGFPGKGGRQCSVDRTRRSR